MGESLKPGGLRSSGSASVSAKWLSIHRLRNPPTERPLSAARESAQRNGCCDSKEQPDRQNLRGRPPLELAYATRERPKTRHVRPPVGRGNFRPPAVNQKLFAEFVERDPDERDHSRGARAVAQLARNRPSFK